MSANTNGDDGPELPFPEEHIEDDAAEQAKQVVQEQEEQAEQARKEQYEKDFESAAGDLSTQQWLEQETSKNTDVIEFRGKELEWKQPGVMHRKRMVELASQQNPEEFQDVDTSDDEAVDEALEETFDAEGLKAVDELYGHVLRSLCGLCLDQYLGDESNLKSHESALDSEELPAGAKRWGELPEDDIEDENGNVQAEGVASLFQRVVMERGKDADELGN